MTRETEAVMLLTVSLGKSSAGATSKPLTPTEWGEFAQWLKDRSLLPGELLKGDLGILLEHWQHSKVTVPRIQALLDRGASLALALEKWERAGLWVVPRSDADHPSLLKKRLRQKAPAILFGCGKKELMNASGVAVVGSREASDEDIRFAEDLGKRTAECGELIVFGGARAVDSAAMFGALDADGTAIGVPSKDLLRAATSAKYRRLFMSGDLALVSPFNPEAGFSIGNAMARNKYIYCLTHHAIVVSSKPNVGGTWQGVIENLRNGWVPLCVQRTEAAESGNPKLVERGGRWLPGLDDQAFEAHLRGASPGQGTGGGCDGATNTSGGAQPELPNAACQSTDSPRQAPSIAVLGDAPSHEARERPTATTANTPAEELQRAVRRLVLEHCAEPQPSNAIADALDVTKHQANVWIRQLVQEGALRKVQKLVRYVASEPDLLEKA